MSGIVAQNAGRTSGLVKASAGGGAWTLIKSITAASDSDIDFVDGSSDVVLDSTYPIYVFKFINIHPSAKGNFQFNMSIDGGSNYNVTKTTTVHLAWHGESDAGAASGYNDSLDLAQGTGAANISGDIVTDNDASLSGSMYLFSPSSTTFAKHFIAETQRMDDATSNNLYMAGYGNATSAVDAVQFSMASGNIDAGKIKLFGLKDS